MDLDSKVEHEAAKRPAAAAKPAAASIADSKAEPADGRSAKPSTDVSEMLTVLGTLQGQTLPAFRLKLKPIDDIAVGDAHVVILTEDHRVLVFGDSAHGALGRECKGLEDSAVSEQLILRPTLLDVKSVKRIACGAFHSLLSTGVLR
jgi:hypothetical protein